ncbi:uncharacterized protein METZ01_LOCUS15214 [marine metagenome]|uniref:Uncharacterized protein n=1 Tax=marine metagenome TaxID=408172 RepID=A0A381P688_9ZZZZ
MTSLRVIRRLRAFAIGIARFGKRMVAFRYGR